MLRAALLRTFMIAAPALCVAACSSPYAATEDPTMPGADGGGGSDGGLKPVVIPPGCDLKASPKDSPACIDDGVAVFVAPMGNDLANGTKAAPVKSLTKAFELAGASGLPRVYVCDGTYTAPAEIKSALSIYGGLSCVWALSGNKPRLAPARDVALRITMVSGPVVIESFTIDGAADPATPGDSAIAVFASQSSNVTLRHVVLTAAHGTDGAKGPATTNFTGTKAKSGNNAFPIGANNVNCACTDGSASTGGAGGGFSPPGVGSAKPVVGGPNSGANGANSCVVGGAGAPAGPASASVMPAPVGKLTVAGWDNGTPKSAAGASGLPGQGGGGGGAKSSPAAGGGGGACGGCGGAGGAQGGSGGSSFALLSFNSTVILDDASLTSGPGGNGGPGGAGQNGQDGGDPGTGSGACDGGAGGNGSGGSAGPGGTGGNSVAIAYSGTAPRVGSAPLAHATAGIGGPAGVPGGGSGLPGGSSVPGLPGKAAATLSF